ncbi:MAG: ferrochelatase [Nannocystaceae bacterium]
MSEQPQRRGVLLVDVGTPASTSVADVRRFLREFLDDRRMLDMPTWARKLLVYGVILPFRPRRAAAAYRKIWGEGGSPLAVHGVALAEEVAARLGGGYCVELGVASGVPSLDAAFEKLEANDVGEIIVVPLLPQYASTGRGVVLERVYGAAGKRWRAPSMSVVSPYYDHPGYITSLAAVARPMIDAFEPDHLLTSFHGVPERDLLRCRREATLCLVKDNCCDVIASENRDCYRAHCFATARALTEALEIDSVRVSVSFQSRLGKTPWIPPDTVDVLPQLFERGVRRIAVACPNFVLDCLETLEEIGIRAREQWRRLGGEAFLLLPCLNSHPTWADTVTSWVRGATRG